MCACFSVSPPLDNQCLVVSVINGSAKWPIEWKRGIKKYWVDLLDNNHQGIALEWPLSSVWNKKKVIQDVYIRTERHICGYTLQSNLPLVKYCKVRIYRNLTGISSRSRTLRTVQRLFVVDNFGVETASDNWKNYGERCLNNGGLIVYVGRTTLLNEALRMGFVWALAATFSKLTPQLLLPVYDT